MQMSRIIFKVVLRPAAVIFLLAVFTFGFSGCAAQSPEMVVANFSLAILQGDTTGARRYCTQNFIDGELSTLDAAMAMVPGGMGVSDEDMPDTADFAELYECSISGDTARVSQIGMDFMVYVLKKQGGGWKIDGFEMSMPEGMPSFEDMAEHMPD